MNEHERCDTRREGVGVWICGIDSLFLIPSFSFPFLFSVCF